MTTKYFQLGSELNRAPYTGEDSTEAFYAGQHVTKAAPTTVIQGDTMEIPLFELPAGTRVNGIQWAIGATLGTNTTASIVLRKKSNVINPATTIAGAGGGAASGISASDADIILAINGSASAPTVTSANNAWNALFPTKVEALSPAKNTLQDNYYVGLLVTFGATPTWVAGVDIMVGMNAEFVGNL